MVTSGIKETWEMIKCKQYTVHEIPKKKTTWCTYCPSFDIFKFRKIFVTHIHRLSVMSLCHFQGQFFSGSTHRIYLLGNPVVWWTNLAFLIIFFLVYIINSIKEKRAEAFGVSRQGIFLFQ